MHSVGEKLRTERKKQNRSISAIASETCISARYLEAIEQDDLSALPGGFFYKSFVKQYSNALGMDFSTVKPDVEKVMPTEVEDPLAALSVSYQVAKTEGRISVFPNRAVWAVALLLSTLGAGGSFYHWWQKSQPGAGDPVPDPVQVVKTVPASALPITEPAVSSASPGTVPSSTTAPVTAPTTAPAAPPVTAPAAAATVAVEGPKPEPAKLSVGLSARERTWVSLSSDGKTVFSGVLDASQTKNIEGLDNAKLLTGNAAGIDVSWNGKSIGPLGTHGQVKMVLFTPENFQIISPRKM